jgi:hypothetical protein
MGGDLEAALIAIGECFGFSIFNLLVSWQWRVDVDTLLYKRSALMQPLTSGKKTVLFG